MVTLQQQPSDTPTKRSRLARLLTVFLLASTILAGVPTSRAGAETLDDLRSGIGYMEEPHSDVLRLYRAFFNREPDHVGARYWLDQYRDVRTYENPHEKVLDDFAWSFKASTEFQDQFGDSQSNSEFLAIVYTNVLGRDPDTDGFDYWLSQMNAGLTQHEVVRWVAANDEFKTHYPYNRIYPQVIGIIFEQTGGTTLGCLGDTSTAYWIITLKTHDLPGEITASDPTFKQTPEQMPDGSTHVAAYFEFPPAGTTSNQLVTLRSGDLTIVIQPYLTYPNRPTCPRWSGPGTLVPGS